VRKFRLLPPVHLSTPYNLFDSSWCWFCLTITCRPLNLCFFHDRIFLKFEWKCQFSLYDKHAYRLNRFQTNYREEVEGKSFTKYDLTNAVHHVQEFGKNFSSNSISKMLDPFPIENAWVYLNYTKTSKLVLFFFFIFFRK